VRVAGEKASIRGCALLLAVTMGAGTAAFAIAEHLAWYDSLYLAAMTGRSPYLRMRIHNLINDPISFLKKGAMRVLRFVVSGCCAAQHRLLGNRAMLRTHSTSMARLPRRILGLLGSMFRVLGLLGSMFRVLGLLGSMFRVLGLLGSMFRVLGLLGNHAMLRTESKHNRCTTVGCTEMCTPFATEYQGPNLKPDQPHFVARNNTPKPLNP
jgi:hypothetical protein